MHTTVWELLFSSSAREYASIKITKWSDTQEVGNYFFYQKFSSFLLHYPNIKVSLQEKLFDIAVVQELSEEERKERERLSIWGRSYMVWKRPHFRNSDRLIILQENMSSSPPTQLSLCYRWVKLKLPTFEYLKGLRHFMYISLFHPNIPTKKSILSPFYCKEIGWRHLLMFRKSHS